MASREVGARVAVGEGVARALGITPGQVAVLLHRAKTALRTCMLG